MCFQDKPYELIEAFAKQIKIEELHTYYPKMEKNQRQ